jgi:hypothetical protein
VCRPCNADRRRAVVVALGLGVAWWIAGAAPAPAPGVQLADFGTGAIIATVVSLLGNLFGWKRGKVDSSTLSALTSIRTSITELGRSFLAHVVDLAGKIASVVGILTRFVAKVFGRLYDLLGRIVNRIVRILDKVFGPIIAFLDKVRAHLKRFYDRILKPIIDTIEMVRSFLRVLSLFGIEWSRKLDAELARIEQLILAPYEFLVAKLNEVSNWINRIVTLDGLLQRAMLLQSLARDVALTNNLWWNSQLHSRGSGPLPPRSGGPESVEPRAVIAELREHFRTGNADISPAIRESAANIRLMLRGIT